MTGGAQETFMLGCGLRVMTIRGNTYAGRKVKILYTSDTHVYPPYFDRLLSAAELIRPEAVIIGGDIIPDWKGGIRSSIEPHKTWVREKMIARLQEFNATCENVPVFVDLGNDDIAAARFLLEETDGKDLHLLHMRLIKLTRKLAVAGYMKVNPTPFLLKDGEKSDCRDDSGLAGHGVVRKGSITSTGSEAPYVLDPADGTIEDDLDLLTERLKGPDWKDFSFIFVSHAPPKNTALDRISAGSNVGSLAVNRFIENWGAGGRLVAGFHGHIHESPWCTGLVWDYVGGTPCFNVGQKLKLLRAVLFDSEDVVESARLVLIGPSKEIAVLEKDEWFPMG